MDTVCYFIVGVRPTASVPRQNTKVEGRLSESKAARMEGAGTMRYVLRRHFA
ncbi:MAG TPA: hypothetical protein VGG99_01555 [Acetobacteraceae bacterium]|jgi:hypothetical protein